MKKSMPRHLALLASAVLTLAALACGEPEPRPAPDPADLPLRGTKPISPLGKVDFVMPDVNGDPYDFRAETEGKIALLFFGYTYCPDICPIHMATLARAMDELDPAERARVEVVFVTVDPERDTPERLGGWLGTFDSTFVAVRGTEDQIEEALAFYRYPPPERSAEGVVYTVGHPALIYAFTPDGLGRAMYGAETRQRDWVHDLRMLTGYPWPAWAGGAPAPEAGPAPEGAGAAAAEPAERPPVLALAGKVLILDAYAPAPADGARTSVYLTLRNTGTAPDTLVGLSSPAAEVATLHRMRTENGMTRMEPLDGLPVPPGETVLLAPGQRHGMLEGVRAGSMEPGGTVELTLTFARSGSVTLPARVIRYQDIGG